MVGMMDGMVMTGIMMVGGINTDHICIKSSQLVIPDARARKFSNFLITYHLQQCFSLGKILEREPHFMRIRLSHALENYERKFTLRSVTNCDEKMIEFSTIMN